MAIKETDDIFRLYRREWVIVHTETLSGPDAQPCFEAAQGWFEQNLKGRVRDEDARLTAHTDLVDQFWCHVEVYKDTLKGEFKHQAGATGYAEAHGYDEYTVVARNSKPDHEVRSYGVKKL